MYIQLRKFLIVGILVLCCSTIQAATIQVEGENYTNVGGPYNIRIVERSSASARKVVSYWEEQGVWLEWEFDVPAQGPYVIALRYACAYPDTYRKIEMDGNLPAKNFENVRFETTGVWQNHKIFTLPDENGKPFVFSLSKGKHKLRMTNVNSRGLAIDLFYVHEPELKFIDVGITENELKPFKFLILEQPAKESVLGPDRMCLGKVNVSFDKDSISGIWVSNTLFIGSEVPAKVTANPIFKRTKNLLIRFQKTGDIWQLFLTDGQSFFMASARPDSFCARIPIFPRVYKSEGQLSGVFDWSGETTAFNTLGDTQAFPESAFLVGDCRMSATGKISPQINEKSINFSDSSRVCAIKFSPYRIRELNIGIESRGNIDKLLSSTRGFPALAAFYDYGRFEVNFEWKGLLLDRCIVNDLGSGEVVQVWP